MAEKKTIIITGASSGVGAAAAHQLRENARVIIVGRSPHTKKVAGELGVEYFLADFAKLSDVRKLAKELLKVTPKIDLLVNNAGLITPELTKTEDGFETIFQVNHLAPFLLTELLMDRLIKSKAGIINTSSVAHKSSELNIDDLQEASRPWIAYANSKLLNIYHAQELARRYSKKGIDAVSFHPGLVDTDFGSKSRGGIVAWLYRTPVRRSFLTPNEGADTLVWLAHNRHNWLPGGYYDKRQLAETSELAKDSGLAAMAWEATEALLK